MFTMATLYMQTTNYTNRDKWQLYTSGGRGAGGLLSISEYVEGLTGTLGESELLVLEELTCRDSWGVSTAEL